MTNPRVAVLTDEFEAKRAFLDGLDNAAAEEKRDLNDTERADYDAAVTRMESIQKDVEEISKRQERFDAVAVVTQRVSPAYTKDRSPVEVPSLGEQIKIRAQHSLGRNTGAYDELQTTLQRSLQHGVSSDGIAPVTIEGDLLKFVDANRYAVNASRRLPMPDNHAPTFQRPKATQFTTVDLQANQGDVLSSQAFKVVGTTLTKATYGGVLSLSEQEIDWTEPAMLGLAVQDLAESYAIKTDTVLCQAISANVHAATPSHYTTLSLTATPTQLIAALSSASASVYSTSKKLADTLFVDPLRWAYLTALVDTTGRPLFPLDAVFNSAGTNGQGVTGFTGFNIMGLNVVVDPNFIPNSMFAAASQLIEVYEQNKGLLSIAAPSTLETQIAYRGYFTVNVITEGVEGLAP